MKKLRSFTLLFIFFSLFNLSLSAEIINIINDNPKATLTLNNQRFKGSLFNYEIAPGSHYLKVSVGDDIIYSNVIQVNKDEVTTIDTNRFFDITDSEIPNKEVHKYELARLRKARGTFAIGGHLGSISGLSIKKYFGPIGIQVVGFAMSGTSSYSNDFSYTGYETDGSEESDYAYNIRLIWNIKDKLTKKDTPMTLFTGIGYGYSTYDDDYTIFHKEKTVSEVFIGTEFPSRLGYFTFAAVFRVLEETYIEENYIWYTGYDYEFVDSLSSGITLNLGYHWYF